MKKHNASGVLNIIFIASALICGCRSAPKIQTADVNPLDLLDNSGSFYICMPSQTDPELVARILQNSTGVSEKDARTAASCVDTVFAGLYRTRDTTEIQAAADGKFPGAAVKALFTKKNGWKQDSFNLAADDGTAHMYKIYNGTDVNMQVAFPSDKLICVNNDVKNMLSVYDKAAYYGKTEKSLSDDMYNWLSAGDGSIRFFADKPQSFLTILTGANLNLKLVYVRGYMINDPSDPTQYLMNMEFEFRDIRMVQAGEGVLSLAFGLTNSQVIKTSETHIQVSDIQIKKKQLYKLFSL